MSTLTEIEDAIEKLPPELWVEIRRWLNSRMAQTIRPAAVDWSRSAAVTRVRRPETRLSAGTVSAALAAVRE